MSVFNSVRETLAPVHKEGYPFIIAGVVASLVLGWLWEPLGWAGAVVTLWICYFFRDPVRVTPQDPDVVISPADGRISSIVEVVPPPELQLGQEKMLRISVFMNVFDVHVNRAPVAGRVARIAYTPGLFLNADLDKASEDNERSAMVIETPRGPVGVVQIAGLVARRIVSFVKEGDQLAAGQRFGLIRFGSRVDVFLPAGVVPAVGLNQRAVAGETVLADLRAGAQPRVFVAS